MVVCLGFMWSAGDIGWMVWLHIAPIGAALLIYYSW